MPKILSEEEKENRKIKRLSIVADDEVYSGIRKLAALNEKSMAAYIYDLLAAEVKNQMPAINKVFEAQKIITQSQQSLFPETKKAAE